jgi:hypothetical protein
MRPRRPSPPRRGDTVTWGHGETASSPGPLSHNGRGSGAVAWRHLEQAGEQEGRRNGRQGRHNENIEKP